MLWSLLVAAGALLALGTLNVRQAPDWSAWRLGVLAGEFGHWLALVAAGVAAIAWRMRAVNAPWALAAGALALVAAGLLVLPTWQARRIGRTLASRLAAEFGPVTMGRRAFSVAGHIGRDPKPVAVETHLAAPGLPLDFYRPVRMGSGSVPCVVVVHGGGWDGGDRAQLPELNHWLARRGWAVAAVSYRLAPKHRWPAQQEDVRAAITFLKARAPELGIDATRLVLLGRSAGGQIALMAAYGTHDPAIRGVIGLYAPTDLFFGYVNTHEHDMLQSPTLMRQLLGGPPETVRAAYDAASPLNFVTKRSPPTLLLHGRNDALSWHRHSERLATRLAEHGVPHVYVELPWATHAFDYNLHGPGGQLTCFAVEWFVRAVTAETAMATKRHEETQK